MTARQFSDLHPHASEFTKTTYFTPPKCLLKGSNLLLMLAVLYYFLALNFQALVERFKKFSIKHFVFIFVKLKTFYFYFSKNF
jgi:hypothetical protein